MSGRHWVLTVLATLTAVTFLAGGLGAHAAGGGGLASAVAAVLPETGVRNPVTAVLLDLRGYDTMLELGVLLIAWVGATAVAHQEDGAQARDSVPSTHARTVDRALARILLAPLVLLGAYLLWRGADAPGGAFQGGAIVAAASVAWRLGTGAEPLLATPRWTVLAAAGLLAFLCAGAAGWLTTGTFLDYPREAAAAIMMAVEVAVLVGVAFVLSSLVDAVLALAAARRAEWPAPPGVTTSLGYAAVGLVLAALGLWGVLALAHMLRKLLALNVMASGVFLVLVASAMRSAGAGVDPVPHALVLTGLVVSVSATALGVVLLLRGRAGEGRAPADRDRTSGR